MINPSQPAAAAQGDEVAAAARALGLRVSIVYASSQGELDNAIAACVQMGAGGLVVTADALFFNRQKELVTLAARHAIPAIYEWRDFVLAGGLASYGSSDIGVSPRMLSLQPFGSCIVAKLSARNYGR